MNKKLVFALMSVLIVLTIITVSISAFQVDDSYTVITSRPSRDAVQNMLDVFFLQQNLGFISSDFSVISISFDYDISAITLLASKSPSSISVSSSNNFRSYSGPSRSLVPYVWTSSGWSYPYNFVRNPTSSFTVYASYHYYSSITVPDAGSYAGFTGLNSNSVFGSSDSSSSSVLSYYNTYYDRLIGYDSAVSEAFSEGESIGFDIGRQEGYEIGYDDGFHLGEDIGYQTGFSEGESIGFDIGRQEGYEIGYDDGYQLGEDIGYQTGFSEGESVGYLSGHHVGFDEGREEGYTLGFDAGYDEGESVGYLSGHRVGFDEGREEGYTLGFDAGYDEGYSDGYETVYDVLQQPGIIEAVFITKDSSGNTLYLAQEADLVNHKINYAFLPLDQLSNTYVGYRLFVNTYDVTKYLEDHPLDFDYPLPVIDTDADADFFALYRKVNVTRENVTGYKVYSVVEVAIDQSFIEQLSNQYNAGLNDANALVNGIGDIASRPIKSLKDALDFEIFGLNIGIVAVGIVSILFAIWAYNKIRKLLPI